MAKRNEFVDFAKGAAIIWIIIYHIYELLVVAFGTGQHGFLGNLPLELYRYFMPEYPVSFIVGSFSTFGYLGVSIFIIMSGFLLYWTGQNRKTSYLKSVKKRFFRAFPLYWVTMAIFILMRRVYFGEMQVTVPQILLNIFGLQSILGINAFSVNPSFWFLGLYLQIILLSPFILEFFKKYDKKLILVSSLIISTVSIIIFKDVHEHFITVFILCRLFELVAGMYFAYRWEDIKKASQSRIASLTAPFTLLVFLLSTSIYTYPVSKSFEALSVIWVLLIIYVRNEDRLPTKAVVRYGLYSYAAFLINQPNISFYFRILSRFYIRHIALQTAIYIVVVFVGAMVFTKGENYIRKKIKSNLKHKE